jgi:hypothetical protein
MNAAYSLRTKKKIICAQIGTCFLVEHGIKPERKKRNYLNNQ